MRVDDAGYLDLVGAFYDAALDPALWHDVLARASDAMSAIGAMYISLDTQRPERSQLVLGRLDSDLTQPYLMNHSRNDPWHSATRLIRPGMAFATDAFVSAVTLGRTEFYADILRPQRILHAGIGVLAQDAERSVGFSVFRSPEVGPFEDRDLGLLLALLPHVKRAAQITWRLAAAADGEQAKSIALDHIDHGVVLVDRAGRVLFTNRAAGATLARGDGLSLTAQGLRAGSTTDTKLLESLIAEASKGIGGGMMRVARPSLAEPWLVLAAPARSQEAWPVDARTAAIIFITDPERAPTPSCCMLRQLFDLTPTEAKVALSIAAGYDVPESARELRISTNTVHTHLRRIFRKLGVRRQADVVRVLMRAGIVMPTADQDAEIAVAR
jgi:DNA-binding CsgD family transcriptional regulator/PAS domain-containing protein